MKKNRHDRIMDIMLNRLERVTDKMSADTKGTNPFDKEKMSRDDLLLEQERRKLYGQ